MEISNNVKESLLPQSSPHEHKQKAVAKKRRYRRYKSAPLTDYTPEAAEDSVPAPSRDSEQAFRGLHPSLRKVTILLCIYLGVGVICFYVIRHQISGKKTNGIVDALYFCVVTMTSVGYGDLLPESTLAKLLACVFVFSGMAFVGMILSTAADYLVEKQEFLLVRALHAHQKLSPSDFMKEVETKKVVYKCLSAFIVLLVLIITGTTFLVLVEKLGFVDSFYCVCATITTLGYGDRSFSTEGGRVFAIVWILVSTICLAQFLLYVAELYTERRQKSLVHWVLTRQVTRTDLEAADINNDGHVEAAEFVLYKLKEMGKITDEDISLVMEEFEELDVDQSGTLSLCDISIAQAPPPEN